MAQQDLSLTAYLTKITKLWNELNCLAPPPKCKCGGCSCGINEEIDALASLTQLMQLLMGLHEVFNNERSQILMLDPLPNVEKAFSMIFSVEQQRAIHTSIDMNSSNVAYQLNLKGNKREDDRYVQKKKFIANKRSLMCSHCHKPGHGQETCFQLHGVPDWHKSLNDRKKKGRSFAANIDDKGDNTQGNAAEVMNQLLELLRKANVSPDPITNHANFAQFEEEFAGNVAKPSCIDLSTWIIDTGATNHVCASIALFHSFAKPANPHFIYLPDGSRNQVQYVGMCSSMKKFFPFLKLLHHLILSCPCLWFHWIPRVLCTYIQTILNPLYLNLLPLDIFLPQPPVVRRSSRITRRPLWLDDFVSVTSNPHIVHPSNAAYTSFVAPVSILQEPKSFQEAMRHQEWIDAMKAELTTLEDNQTWILTPLPAGKKPIGCNWVYKTKLRADGYVERCKARLVAKGFTQVPGVDYTDNFSPVAKPVTVQVFLSIAAAHNWPLQQMDVNNAFLHGYLEEDLYMKPPEGYPVQKGLFANCSDNGLLALLVYVDDIIVTAPSLELIQTVKDYLHSLFTIKDLDNARYFLGLEIARSSDGLYLAQTKYVHDIIKDTGMSAAKSIKTPFPLGLKLATASGAPLSQPDQYHRLIGRLLYLGFTRPDISHSVQQLSQFLTRPCDAHWRATLHVVRYLKGEPSKGLFFPTTCNFELTAYCDGDWASCTDSRRSLTGYCIFLGAALAALHIMANPVFHERTKHIEIDCHVVRSAYKDGFLTPLHIHSSLQLADIFTKSLPLKTFAFLLAKLLLAALHSSPTCGGAVELGNVSVMDDKAATIIGI
ncbi:uncharacterized protein LOC110013287 [Sesamum indicum]|uniref:Uncharacterized protein LOC110013287 n=1 Tax=Sesamum indicum TaxID=4182 RepID=A0A8M8V7T6_SESIN|nr:uncharacterized protein LOC110013287 [Sesamum indicum]